LALDKDCQKEGWYISRQIQTCI